MFFYQSLHFYFVEIAHSHHGHQVGTVPVFVKSFESLVFEILDDVFFADGKPFGIKRAFKKDGKLLVPHSCTGSLAQSPLFDDHSSLLVDLLIFEREGMRPVLQNLKRCFYHLS